MRGVGCSETSVRNYHTTLRNIPEERIFRLHLCYRFRIFSVSLATVLQWIHNNNNNNNNNNNLCVPFISGKSLLFTLLLIELYLFLIFLQCTY